jgi:hypothetical protein
MNRKVVYNACYGGFNLSPRAEKMLYEKKHPGETVYFYKKVYEDENDDGIRSHTYLKVDEKDLDSCDAFIIHCVSLDFGKEITFEDGSIEDKRFNFNSLQPKIEIPVSHLDFFKRIHPNSVCVIEDKHGIYNDKCFVVKHLGKK